MKDFIIISGANKNRFSSFINHRNYANYHNYNYKFYTTSDIKQTLTNYAYLKIYAILDSLKEFKKVLWIDDDAFFLNFPWNCKEVFGISDAPLIVSQSHSVKKNTPLLNSGVLFCRSHDRLIKMLNEIPDISNKELKNNWNNFWGSMSGNDQPRFIYQVSKEYKNITKIIPYTENSWNKKPRHCYKPQCQIVHFAGDKKTDKIRNWETKTGISLLDKKLD